MQLTESYRRDGLLAEDSHVERLAHEVLQTVDGVDGPTLRVDVDRVHRHVHVGAVVLRQSRLVEVVGRELERVTRVRYVAAVVDGADWHVE